MRSVQITQTYFDELAAGWNNDCPLGNNKRLENIFRSLLTPLERPVLDLGSGAGVLLPFLKRFTSGSGLIIQFDIAYQMLQQARQKYGNHTTVAYLMGDGHHLPFSSAQFKALLCFQVFPHFQDKAKVISECHRLLKTDGRLIILHLMGHHELNEMHRQAGRAVQKDRILPADQLAFLLEQGGFFINQATEQSDLYLIDGVK